MPLCLGFGQENHSAVGGQPFSGSQEDRHNLCVRVLAWRVPDIPHVERCVRLHQDARRVPYVAKTQT